MKDVLRWLLVFPGAIAVGFLATFPLHWILLFLFNGGEADIGSPKFFVQIFGSGVNYAQVEILFSPFIMAIFYIIAGAKIAPKHKFKTSIALFILYLIIWGSISFLALSKSQVGMFSLQFSERTILALLGALLGVIVVKFTEKNKNESLVKSVGETDLADKTFIMGSKRERTELDDSLDKFTLDKYYEEHKEERTPEKDAEILRKSYLMEKGD